LENRRISERRIFRFTHVTDEVLKDLREVMEDKEGLEDLRINPQYGAPEKFAVLWDIEEGVDYGWIGRFAERSGLRDDTYGVLVSLVTEEDRGRVRAPKFLIDLSRQVGGVIDFSFTVI